MRDMIFGGRAKVPLAIKEATIQESQNLLRKVGAKASDSTPLEVKLGSKRYRVTVNRRLSGQGRKRTT